MAQNGHFGPFISPRGVKIGSKKTAMGTFIFDLLSNYGSKMFMGGAIDQFVVFALRKR